MTDEETAESLSELMTKIQLEFIEKVLKEKNRQIILVILKKIKNPALTGDE